MYPRNVNFYTVSTLVTRFVRQSNSQQDTSDALAIYRLLLKMVCENFVDKAVTTAELLLL